MSLGAIDFGLLVDSSVIQIENVMRRITESGGRERTGTLPEKHADLVRDAVIVFVPNVVFALGRHLSTAQRSRSRKNGRTKERFFSSSVLSFSGLPLSRNPTELHG